MWGSLYCSQIIHGRSWSRRFHHRHPSKRFALLLFPALNGHELARPPDKVLKPDTRSRKVNIFYIYFWFLVIFLRKVVGTMWLNLKKTNPHLMLKKKTTKTSNVYLSARDMVVV